MKKNTNCATIRCPHCNREYLPAEIYIPNAFFGRPDKIERNYEGDIINYDNNCMDLNETYTCDNCGTTFSINAQIKFNVKDETSIFDDDYVITIQPPKLTLDESL